MNRCVYFALTKGDDEDKDNDKKKTKIQQLLMMMMMKSTCMPFFSSPLVLSPIKTNFAVVTDLTTPGVFTMLEPTI